MRIHSIFKSINGEVTARHQGSITTFIRMQGCNLFLTNPCNYCDTKESLDPKEGIEMTIGEIIEQLEEFNTLNVTITGGEPLLQRRELFALLNSDYMRLNHFVTLETNGSLFLYEKPLGPVDSIVMDVKLKTYTLPIFIKNITNLDSDDWIKIPIQNVSEFKQASVLYQKYKNETNAEWAFSAVWPLRPKELLSWMLADNLNNVVLNTQLHKLIGVV